MFTHYHILYIRGLRSFRSVLRGFAPTSPYTGQNIKWSFVKSGQLVVISFYGCFSSFLTSTIVLSLTFPFHGLESARGKNPDIYGVNISLSIRPSKSLKLRQMEHYLLSPNRRSVKREKNISSANKVTCLVLDRLGVANPTSRDKLLAAVHELKLFGGPIPDERQFRLNVPGTNNRAVSPRTKRRSLPARPANMQQLMKGILPDSAEKGSFLSQ